MSALNLALFLCCIYGYQFLCVATNEKVYYVKLIQGCYVISISAEYKIVISYLT